MHTLTCESQGGPKMAQGSQMNSKWVPKSMILEQMFYDVYNDKWVFVNDKQTSHAIEIISCQLVPRELILHKEGLAAWGVGHRITHIVLHYWEGILKIFWQRRRWQDSTTTACCPFLFRIAARRSASATYHHIIYELFSQANIRRMFRFSNFHVNTNS